MGTASSGLPCTAHRSIDQIDSCPERGVYIQIRGVEQERVFGAGARGPGAALVAPVAAPDFGEHFGLGNRRLPASFQLAVAAARALSGAAVTKSFTSASGQMTVPMSRPSSTAPGFRRAKAR